ncbi:DUF2195 family protein [Ochrobactrum teleogrylli]
MIRLIPGVLAVSVFCAPALSAEADDVVVKNDLSACVTLNVGEIQTDANIVSVSSTIWLRQPIGACGCMSALATYSSSVANTGVREVLQEAIVSLRKDGTKTFILASDQALIAGKTVQIHLRCARAL